jgi:alkylhydroperoxidase family enzyme
MTVESSRQARHDALVDRILHSGARTSPDLRRQAFDNDGLPETLAPVLARVAAAPATVTDADLAALRDAGYGEDQIFELVICAAVGEASRQYEAGMAALAAATSRGERS